MSVLAPVLPLVGGLGWVSPPLLAHLGDQQGAHASARAATKGMAQLEALQAVAALGLLSSDLFKEVPLSSLERARFSNPFRVSGRPGCSQPYLI